MKKIKLIIWNLDETFWFGTLSEEGIKIPPKNVKLIKTLTERGIINAICSKNEEKQVNKVLKKEKLSKYFVFNSINWEPKGMRIKRLIEDMNLRPPNVLFIDDNPSNIKEAEFYAKGIHTSLPDIIDKLETHPALKGKDDKKLSRLKQYKVLETKREKAKKIIKEDILGFKK